MIEVGDKLLCRRTHYDSKGRHIWQIGKYYDVYSTDNNIWRKYGISCEGSMNNTLREEELKIYFLVDKKRLRRYKLYKLNKNAKR